ncbi:MAG: PEP-CTERM sorting domain-containing protein [Gemmataceae bacterium]|nr:PEP-CTERM sorting domain-containing protein [Gemmataceae bacterium]
MTRPLFLGALAVALATAVAAPASAAITITVDDYTAGPLALVQTGAGTTGATQGGLPPANVLGTERESTLNVTASDFGLSTAINILTGPGVQAISDDAGNASTLTQLYDGPGSAGLGGVDLTAGGGAFFEFDVISSDLGVTITITVEDTLGNTSSLTLPTAGPGLLDFDFASFVGTADFTSVNAIQVVFDSPRDADTVLDFFGVGAPVPEPASVGLLLSGVVAAGGFARRRLAKKA